MTRGGQVARCNGTDLHWYVIAQVVLPHDR